MEKEAPGSRGAEALADSGDEGKTVHSQEDAHMTPVGDYSTAEQREMEMSEHETAYRNMTSSEKADVAHEWLDHVGGYDLFFDWLMGRVKRGSPEYLVEYAERVDSFWDYLRK